MRGAGTAHHAPISRDPQPVERREGAVGARGWMRLSRGAAMLATVLNQCIAGGPSVPKAIDVHVHAPLPPASGRDVVGEQMARYFKDRDIIAVLLWVDARTQSDRPQGSNDWIAELVRRHPDQFIGFGSVDPHMGREAVREARRCVEELGLRGFKFHPITQRFEANDPRFYPLWQTISDLGVPALFHTGQTGVGARTPGQSGIKNKYGRPYPYFDDLAADFPELTIILAHPSFPWVDEQLSVANLKTNVYLDLSGWSPKYFSQNLVQYCNTLLQDKALFGSDYPAITPDRWLRDFAEAPFSDEVRPKILLENARRVLKLTG
jgi:predicted TIM-barrel fold metal-dependent hydrolase